MKKRLTLLLILALSSPLLADSIDDAEAKRRGIPVAQVQAENALEKEKAKTAALEKQLATLQKQLAEKSGTPAPADTPSPTASPTAKSGTATPTPTTPTAPLNFAGPRESSPLYDDFVKRYLDGNWTTLAADLAAKQKEIAALPAGNLADLTYIKQTLAESRPAWWDQLKDGKIKQVKATVWKKTATFNYQDAPAVRFAGNTPTAFNLAWPLSGMDSQDPLPLENISLNIPGQHDYKSGDAIQESVWGMLGSVAVHQSYNLPTVITPNTVSIGPFAGFMQNITAAYYATPPGRRLVFAGSLAAFNPQMDNRLDWVTRRPLGAALMIEITAHPDRFTALHMEPILGLDQLGAGGPSPEIFLTAPLVLQIIDAKLTLEEDRHLRDLIKSLADTNPISNVTKINLPNNFHMDLNLPNDTTYASQRAAFLTPKK